MLFQQEQYLSNQLSISIARLVHSIITTITTSTTATTTATNTTTSTTADIAIFHTLPFERYNIFTL